MTREPPLNGVGVTFARVGARQRVEDVVHDVEAQVDRRAGDDRQDRERPRERPIARGDREAEEYRYERRGQER